MATWMIFLLGSWLGCVVGFLVAGLTAASRVTDASSLSHTSANQVSLSGALAEDAAH